MIYALNAEVSDDVVVYRAVGRTYKVPFSEIESVSTVSTSNGLRKFEYPVIRLKDRREIKLRAFINPIPDETRGALPPRSYTEMVDLVRSISGRINSSN